MANIIDYVRRVLDRFQDKEFNPVDSLVLSQFSYIHLNSLVPGLLRIAEPVKIKDILRAERFDKMFLDVRDAEKSKQLLFAMSASPRFRDLRMSYFKDVLDPVREKQFAAVTFFLDEDTAYLAFRGTDDTFTGWKEDFNMAYISPVPSQVDALHYAEAVAERFPGGLILGGHSKGGNLAVYAAMKSPPAVQDRILRIFSHDGPGFKDKVFETPEFQRISGKIHKTIPQSSLIGMLLENQENYVVVESSRFGFMQHDPFSWTVEEDDFHILRQLAPGSQYLNKTLSDWIDRMSSQKREQFVDALYEVLHESNSNISTFSEFSAEWQKNIPAVLAAARNVDGETRGILLQTMAELAVVAVKNLPRPHIGGDKTE